MSRILPAAALLLLAPALAAAAGAASRAAAPAEASSSAAAPADGVGMVDASLIEALAAIKKPEVVGVFSFVSEQDSPFAFADLLARDQASLKRYLKKLDADKKAANGLTAWDHDVCASLVNLYASPLASTFGKPAPKWLSKVNECVLAQALPLSAIVDARRKR
ncbi:MAG: hypothetical protein KGM24_09435 [Elusimicrobia bacterium]|nr:hypothetical protein [Elusimicrobiota bacterium]